MSDSACGFSIKIKTFVYLLHWLFALPARPTTLDPQPPRPTITPPDPKGLLCIVKGT